MKTMQQHYDEWPLKDELEALWDTIAILEKRCTLQQRMIDSMQMQINEIRELPCS